MPSGPMATGANMTRLSCSQMTMILPRIKFTLTGRWSGFGHVGQLQ